MPQLPIDRPAAFTQQLGPYSWQAICGYCGWHTADPGRLPCFQRVVQHLADEHAIDPPDGASVAAVGARGRG